MKRFVFAAALLISCFAIAVFGFFSLKKSSFELIEKLSESAEYIKRGNSDEAKKALEEVEELWKSGNIAFNVFLDHTTLDTLDSSIPSILKILSSGDSEKAFEEIQKNIAVLRDIVEEQRISIGNIL